MAGLGATEEKEGELRRWKFATIRGNIYHKKGHNNNGHNVGMNVNAVIHRCLNKNVGRSVICPIDDHNDEYNKKMVLFKYFRLVVEAIKSGNNLINAQINRSVSSAFYCYC